jgi:hypothetical protein
MKTEQKPQTQQIQFVNTSINRQILYFRIVSAGWEKKTNSHFPQTLYKTYAQVQLEGSLVLSWLYLLLPVDFVTVF